MLFLKKLLCFSLEAKEIVTVFCCVSLPIQKKFSVLFMSSIIQLGIPEDVSTQQTLLKQTIKPLSPIGRRLQQKE